MIGGTNYRADGEFYVVNFCSRCSEKFYTWALHGLTMYEAGLAEMGIMYCDWRSGKCSAAEQSHKTYAVGNIL